MSTPQQSMPSSPLMSQPFFLVDVNGNPITSTNGFPVTVSNANPNGQATMANSSPVVLASDEVVPVRANFTQIIGASAGSVTGTGTPLVNWTDVSAYRWGSLQLTGTFNLTLQVQFSLDGVNPVATSVFNGQATGFINTITSVGLYTFPVIAQWMRIIPSAFTSNTSMVGTVNLFSLPAVLSSMAVQQIGTWTVQPGNTQNTTPWLMAGPNANGTQAANTAANTVIKASPGWLYHAIVTTLGTAGLTIFDNASTNSGTPLLVIPASAAVGTIYSFPSGARAVSGIVSAGVTNCPAVTFHYT